MVRCIFFCLSFITLANSSIAQTKKIDTDRPDQTESPFIVPKKWMQFEMGFLKQSDKFNDRFKEIDFEHPTLLTKYGLTKCFEFRLITTYATSKGKIDNLVTDRKSGITNVQLGGKVNFFKENGLRPKTSLIAHYNFGSLRTLYKDTLDGANFRFTMQNTLSKTISLGYNIGMQWDRFGFDPAYIYTFAPGFNISEKWYAYIELFGFIWKNEKPENSFDAGIAYYINDNFKIDLSAGFGINEKAPDNYFAIGASFRFKTTNK